MLHTEDSTEKIEWIVASECTDGYTEADFGAEMLQQLERCVANFIVIGEIECGRECIVDVYSRYIDLFGKRLAVVDVRVPPDEISKPASCGMVVFGFTERGMESLRLCRVGSRPIDISEPECVRMLKLLFDTETSGVC